MLSVIVIWIYMILTTLATGFAVVSVVCRFTGYSPRDLVSYIVTGIVGVTVYAQIWSMFGGVGLWANVVMCILLLTVCMVVVKTGSKADTFKRCASVILNDRAALICAVILFLVMAYGSSHGIMHYDTGLYHAQSIRWIEEFGVVPGLANLHTRLGYNSSAFVLTALYSMSFTGHSYHVAAGFVALVLAWECMAVPLIYRKRFREDIGVSFFARIMALYYLFMIYDEMVSPASDYFMVCLAFILVIRWLDTREEAERNSDPEAAVSTYCMLAYLACFILTVKLSGALLILFAIYPAYLLIRSRRVKEIFFSVAAGMITIAPYLIRNVILSGRLLYPSVAFDVFDVSWKVPYGTSLYDYREIQVYGRGFTDVSKYGDNITKWFGSWFSGQSLTDRILILAAIVGAVYFVVKCIVTLSLRTELVIIACLAFWMFTSPLMRYGCLYVYLCDALVWGGLLCRLTRGHPRITGMVLAVVSLILCYKSFMLVSESAEIYRNDTWITQQDYETFETYPYEMTDADGDCSALFYAPVSGDRCGYEAFPSSPWEMSGLIRLRGDRLKDGFESVQ